MQNAIKKIGFIGTSIMGGHMARRLAQSGFEVSAWNRTASKSVFVPGGPAVYQLKDLVSARELALGYGLDLPLLKAAEDLFGDRVAHGDGDLDNSGVIREIARRTKH